MNKFKHSGAAGDLLYSLALMKHFGGGEFYLHLNQMDWIGQHYYGSKPDPFHQGRMTQADFEFMIDFMAAQEYVHEFYTLDPSKDEITHNLDRFRKLFVGHPSNYINTYCMAFNVTDLEVVQTLNSTPWLTVPEPVIIEGRDIVINRTARWQPKTLSDQWATWKADGLESQSVFVGLPREYESFKAATGWYIPYHPTNTLLELAQIIAGADAFIGNQSQCLALAIGLGVDYACEARDDLPLDRNECYFPQNPRGSYF